MEKVIQFINSVKNWMHTAGPVWDAFVIIFFILVILVWMDLFIGSRIRLKATSMAGILLESAMNWYSLKKNIAKARSLHIALRKQYWVVPIGGQYHVINNRQRKRINRILSRHHLVININDLLNSAVYHTR